MSFAESRSDTVPVQLPNGAIIKVEVTKSGREDVSFDPKQFQPVADAIEGVVLTFSPIYKPSLPMTIIGSGKRFTHQQRSKIGGEYQSRIPRSFPNVGFHRG